MLSELLVETSVDAPPVTLSVVVALASRFRNTVAFASPFIPEIPRSTRGMRWAVIVPVADALGSTESFKGLSPGLKVNPDWWFAEEGKKSFAFWMVYDRSTVVFNARLSDAVARPWILNVGPMVSTPGKSSPGMPTENRSINPESAVPEAEPARLKVPSRVASIPTNKPNSERLGGTIVPAVATPIEITAWALATASALTDAEKPEQERLWSRMGKSLLMSMGRRFLMTVLSKELKLLKAFSMNESKPRR